MERGDDVITFCLCVVPLVYSVCGLFKEEEIKNRAVGRLSELEGLRDFLGKD